jgi:hypothetical protein
MGDNNTRIPVNEDVAAQAREVKDDHGDTWTEVVQFYIQARGNVGSGGVPDGVTPDVTRNEGDTDEILSAVKTVEERTGHLEQMLEDMGGR